MAVRCAVAFRLGLKIRRGHHHHHHEEGNNDQTGHGSNAPCPRALRTTMARSEVRVRGPVHGGEALSSVINGLVEDPQNRRLLGKAPLPGEPWRQTEARRSSGLEAGLQADGEKRGGDRESAGTKGQMAHWLEKIRSIARGLAG